MMNDIMEWILSKMRLVDVDELEEQGAEIISIENKPERIYKKRENRIEEHNCIYCKVIKNYADCNQGIEYYRRGSTCIYIMDPLFTQNDQYMLNYLSGAVFALGGEVCEISRNIFLAH